MDPPINYNVDEPWLRQPFDSDDGWLAFQDFLAMGPARSVRIVAQKFPAMGWTAWQMLSLDCAWETRADLWDRHLDLLRVRTIEGEIQETARDMAKRHFGTTRKLFKVLDRELELLEKASRQSSMHGLIRPETAFRALERVIKLERLIIGEATERPETGPDLSNLSVDELRQLRELSEKASHGSGT